MSSNTERNLLSWGIVLGAVTGAVAAYFLAPKSGDETKKVIARKLNSFSQKSIVKTQDLLINLEGALEKDLDKDIIEQEKVYY